MIPPYLLNGRNLVGNFSQFYVFALHKTESVHSLPENSTNFPHPFPLSRMGVNWIAWSRILELFVSQTRLVVYTVSDSHLLASATYPNFSHVSVTFRMPQYSSLIFIIKETCTLCEQNAEFLNVKGGGLYSYRFPFKG